MTRVHGACGSGLPRERARCHAEIRFDREAGLRNDGSEESCRCPATRARETAAALHTLSGLYPEARFAPITIAVGRGKPVGVGGRDTGVQIGLEALCATDWINPDIEDRFMRVIVHEYAHRIVKSYYRHADDKRQALRDIFGMTNPDDFLARSGWRPGGALDQIQGSFEPTC